MEEQIDIQLWNYMDGLSSNEERSSIERLLQENAEWKNRYSELLALQDMLQASTLEEPSIRFTKNVMEAIAQESIAPSISKYINQRVIWGIGIFLLLLITGSVLYCISQVSWSGSSSTIIQTDKLNLDKVDFSQVFNNNLINAFLLINIILGLFFFDRLLSSRRIKMEDEG